MALPIGDGAATKAAKEMLGLASTKVLASSSLLTTLVQHMSQMGRGGKQNNGDGQRTVGYWTPSRGQ